MEKKSYLSIVTFKQVVNLKNYNINIILFMHNRKLKHKLIIY